MTAKRAGMKVTEYFVGFGPRLWSVRRGETEYGVKAIPAGGYVRITGFTSTEEVRRGGRAPGLPPAAVPPADHRGVGRLGHALPHRLRPGPGPGLHLRDRRRTTTRSPRSSTGRGGRRRPRWPGCRPGDTIVSVDGKTFTQPELHDRRHQALRRHAPRPRGRARRQAHPPDGDARQRQGHHGRTGSRWRTAATSASRSSRPPRRSGCCRPSGHRLSPPCGSVTDQEVTGIGADVLAAAGCRRCCHQVTNSKAAQSGRQQPRLGAAARSPSSASPTSARSPSRRAWPRS